MADADGDVVYLPFPEEAEAVVPHECVAGPHQECTVPQRRVVADDLLRAGPAPRQVAVEPGLAEVKLGRVRVRLGGSGKEGTLSAQKCPTTNLDAM